MLTRFVCLSFLFKEQVHFNFMATITIHSDFRAQEEKTFHFFHFYPLLFASDRPGAMILVS